MPMTEQRLGTEPAAGPARVEHREQNAALNLALSGLTENQQEIVKLRFQEGLRYSEISEITGLSVSNVGFQLHDALRRIRQSMEVAR